MSSWDALRADYFENACRSLLDDVMLHNGFQGLAGEDHGVGVVYVRDDRFFEISYYLEDSPDYVPMTSVGLRVERPCGGCAFDGIGLWKLLPKDHPGMRSPIKRFRSEPELRAVVERLRDELIVPFALPLLDHPSRLPELLASQHAERMDRFKKESEDQWIAEARAAYARCDFDAALRFYARVRPDRLLRSDLGRIEISRTRLSDQ